MGRDARESVHRSEQTIHEAESKLNTLFSALATTSGASYDLILHC